MVARYRHPVGSTSPPPPASDVPKTEREASPAKPIKHVADQTSSFSLLDILRIVAGLLLLSSGMSYLSTSGESMTWGFNPWWTRAREWKALIQGQVYLTDTELAQYDGTDPTKPIYLALNGTIYDVSSNPDTYGPGGSYHFFAGRDAARAFLTGCFQEDQTPDLRGVEEMYIPIDPEPGTPEADKVLEREKKLTKAERKNRHAKELREAKKKIKEGIEHWAKLFRGDKGKPYHKVGTVVREDGWLEKLPKRELCEAARKNRPVRKLDDA